MNHKIRLPSLGNLIKSVHQKVMIGLQHVELILEEPNTSIFQRIKLMVLLLINLMVTDV